MMIHRWMKGALKRARRKAAAFASHGQNGREASKGRGSRDTRGMKGWRPSACPKARNRFELFYGRILCRTSDRSACLFPRVLGPRPRALDPGITRGSARGGFPSSRNEARGRQVGRKWRRKRSAIETAPALHLLEKLGGPGNDDRRSDKQPEASQPTPGRAPPPRPGAAQA